MVVVSTLQTANYDVKEKLHREKSAGGELIELSKQFGESKGAHGVKLVVLEVLESQRGRNSFKFRVLSLETGVITFDITQPGQVRSSSYQGYKFIRGNHELSTVTWERHQH